MEEKIVVTQESIDATNKKIDRRLDKLDEEVTKVNKKIDHNDDKMEEIKNIMDHRLTALETEMIKSTRIGRQSDELRQLERNLVF